MIPQRIKITEPGWDSYNGNLAGVDFENGVSVDVVIAAQAHQIGSMLRTELCDDGTQAGAAKLYQDHVTARAPVVAEMERTDAPHVPGEEPKVVVPVEFTRATLEAIADEKGIAGIREISDKLDIKGTSIVGLIDAIVSKTSRGA